MKKRSCLVWGMILGLLALLVYTATYLCLTLMGDYGEKLLPSRTTRYTFGLSVPSRVVWQPKYTVVLPREQNGLGVLFWPLVELDRAVWHRDINASDFFDETVTSAVDLLLDRIAQVGVTGVEGTYHRVASQEAVSFEGGVEWATNHFVRVLRDAEDIDPLPWEAFCDLKVTFENDGSEMIKILRGPNGESHVCEISGDYYACRGLLSAIKMLVELKAQDGKTTR